MAPSHSLLPWVAGVCCLPRCLADEGERFPLAGGLPVGVTLSVKGKFSDVGGTLDFLTPDATSVASLSVTQSSLNREVQGTKETWGNEGFTLKEDVNELTFLKTHNSLQVSVNGQRSPWFDVDVGDVGDRHITHMYVGSGVSDPEVVLRRTTCQQVCSAAECDTCTKDGEASPVENCFSKSASGSCTTSQNTDEPNMMDVTCCDGTRESIRFDTAGPPNIQVVDSNLVNAACNAYFNELSEKMACYALRGQGVVEGDCRFGCGDNVIKVWQPIKDNLRCRTSVDVDEGEFVRTCRPLESVKVPKDILVRSVPTISQKTVSADGEWAFHVENHIIGDSNDESLIGKRVMLIKSNDDIWRSWTPKRWAAQSGSVDILMADGDFALDESTCADIGEKDCSPFPDNECDEEANDACCACDGGSYEVSSVETKARRFWWHDWVRTTIVK